MGEDYEAIAGVLVLATVLVMAGGGIYVMVYVSKKHGLIRALRARIKAVDAEIAQRQRNAEERHRVMTAANAELQMARDLETQRESNSHFYPPAGMVGGKPAAPSPAADDTAAAGDAGGQLLAMLQEAADDAAKPKTYRQHVPASVQRIFAEMNLDSDAAVLTTGEIARALKKDAVRDWFTTKGLQLTGDDRQDAGILMTVLDKNGGGTITMIEFIAGMGGFGKVEASPKRRESTLVEYQREQAPRRSVAEVFAEMNLDNDDTVLTTDEIARALGKDGIRDYFESSNFQLTGDDNEDAVIIMGALDKNGDKAISVLEFMSAMKQFTKDATRRGSTLPPPPPPLTSVPIPEYAVPEPVEGGEPVCKWPGHSNGPTN